MRAAIATTACLMTITMGSLAAADDFDDLIGTRIAAEVVALDGDTLLVIGSAKELLESVEDPANRPEAEAFLAFPKVLKPGRTRIRLWGISAPEMSDPGGPLARATLDLLLREQWSGAKYRTEDAEDAEILEDTFVFCTVVDIHRPRRGDPRLVGRCELSLVDDLGKEMIERGMATPHRLYTYAAPLTAEALARAKAYDRAELTAILKKVGLWRLGRF